MLVGAQGWVHRGGCTGVGAQGWLHRGGCTEVTACGWVYRGGCILPKVRFPEHSISGNMHSTTTCTTANCQATVLGKPLLSVVALLTQATAA